RGALASILCEHQQALGAGARQPRMILVHRGRAYSRGARSSSGPKRANGLLLVPASLPEPHLPSRRTLFPVVLSPAVAAPWALAFYDTSLRNPDRKPGCFFLRYAPPSLLAFIFWARSAPGSQIHNSLFP